MGPAPLRLLLALLLLLLLPAASLADDSAAMADLARSLTGLPPSWSSPTPCKWAGVKCSGGSVTSIDLNRRSVSGSLPASLASLSSLTTLDLGSNSISGALPILPKSIQTVNLAANSFSSVPATFFSSLPSLQTFTIDDNPFLPWTLPDLSHCTSLSTFSASNTSLTGAIPRSLGSLPSLQSLSLSYNSLNSTIPTSFSGSTLQDLFLNNQKGSGLSGPITVIGSLPGLRTLYLQSNSFTGPIPDVSNLTNLQIFNVRDNHLTGPVPASLTGYGAINQVVLSNNFLQGPSPVFKNSSAILDVSKGNFYCQAAPGPCDERVNLLLDVAGGFGYPEDIANSWTGNDPCSGSSSWIGVTCGANGKDITVLNFPNKQYGGVVSPMIANLTTLTRVILNDNNLTGSIPDSLAGMPNLKDLDLSNNDLDGKIPAFSKSVLVKLSGNPNLGGNGSAVSPVSPDSPSSAVSPSAATDSSSPSRESPPDGDLSSGGSSSKGSNGGLIGGIIAAVILLVVCFVLLAYYLRRKKQAQKFGRVETQTPPHEVDMVKIGVAGLNVHSVAASELYSQSSVESANNPHLVEAQGMIISIQALQNATNNFAESNILGRGGFGIVYKGELNGTLIAVKRNESDMMGKKGMEEFKAEIDVLRKVRHRHLVNLLGYCVEGIERLLVYEYMPEGTLGQHLFDLNESGYCAITWTQRLTIALDVARGIEYLHSLAQESFIHRDLKPSNILLDKNLRAKVSDFGLVKLADKEKSMMTRLAGTFGYLAPEYAITGKVSTKVDVYAFGVILMEIIAGRKVLDESLPDEETHLVACFRRNILNKEKFMKSVDPTLDLDEEGWNSLFEVAELARHCTAREPNQRPDMGHAVNVLGPLVEKWKPSQLEDEDNYGSTSVSLNQRLEKWQFSDGTSTMDLFSGYGDDESKKY